MLLRALSISRQESALEFLLHVLENGSLPDARAALEALSLDRTSPEIRRRAEAAATLRGEEIARLFTRFFH